MGRITRRIFLFGTAAVAGGLAVGYWYVQRPYPNPLEADLSDGEATFNPYVKIAPDNTVTVITPRAEMGQGIQTTLAAFVAEELGLTLDVIRIEHGPASFAYYNAAMLEDAGPFPWFDESALAEMARTAFGTVGKVIGLQGTGGSASARDGFDRMRQAGAATRMLLMSAAAARWDVSAGELSIDGGSVRHDQSGRSLTFGELAADAALLDPPDTVELKDRASWTVLGKPQKRFDMLAKVTGAPIFGVDVSLPDMLFGTVRMCPIHGGRAGRSDLASARAVPGVIDIVPLETSYGSGFGVIAQNTWAAFRAADLIDVDWQAGANPPDMKAIEDALSAGLGSNDASETGGRGSVETAFADVPRDRLVEAEYSAQFLAHFCMEPMNATARLADGRLDVWAPNQMPTLTRQLCADALDIDRDAVTVHTTFLGGGFGRRADMDFSIYAALLARAAKGRPVKVTWTREEDVRHDFYRPAAKARLRARINGEGHPTALDFRVAAPSIIASTLARTFPSLPAAGPDALMAQGGFDQPYDLPDFRFSAAKVDLPLPVGIWRSVGFSHNVYFQECFLDEIAVREDMDPIALRRRLMKDRPVGLAVLDRLSELSGWSKPVREGRARGMAFSLAFGSWVGQVVEIAETPKGIRIEKAWIVADVGTALDPGIIEAQLTSAAVFGYSAAMSQEITFRDGRVQQSNLFDFPAMRINQCPIFEVAILETQDKMGGVGEAATPTAIAALANAVSRLKAERYRALPLSHFVGFA